MRDRNSGGRGSKVLGLLLSVAACWASLGASAEDLKAGQEATLEDLLKVKVSTASKYEQLVGEAPASITVITQEEIRRFGYRTLQDVSSSVPGFYFSYDRTYSYLGVRGFGRPTDYNNRILLLLNGMQTNEVIFGSSLLETGFGIDLSDVERIEIVRGPGSTLYGTGAMLAVINVITKKGAQATGLSLTGEAGSFGRLKGKATYGTALKNGLDFFISGNWADIDGQDLYFKEYDDPSTNNGVAQGLDWDKYHSLFAGVSYKGFSLQAYSSSRKKGNPTGAWGVDFNDPNAEFYDAQRFVEGRFEHEFGARLQMTVRAYGYGYDYHDLLTYSAVPVKDESQDRLLGSEVRFLWDTASKNRIVLGLEYKNHSKAFYRYGEEARDYFRGDFPEQVYSLYAQDEFTLSKALTLTVGLRNDHYSTIGNTFVPRASLIYRPFQGSTLKFLYGEAFRAPNIYERYYIDSEETGYVNQKRNPDLGEEKIGTLELAWEQRLSDGLFGTLSLYSFRMNDLIDLGIDPADDFYWYENAGTAKSRGLELGLNARLPNEVLGYASYSYQDSMDAVGDSRLTNSPVHLVKAGVSFPVFRSVYVGLQILHESERLTVYGTTAKPFFLANLNLASKPFFKHLRASLLINNLFDIQYAYPGGYEHLQDAIIQDGRNFIFRLEYLF